MSNNNNNRDILLKTIFLTLLAAVFIVLVYNVISGQGIGIISGLYYGQGFDANSFALSIMVIAVKMLWLIFIVSLIIGLILLIRKNILTERRVTPTFQAGSGEGYPCPCCGTRLTAEFKFCPNCKASLKDLCVKCGRELQVGWRCCPICGEEKRAR